MIHNFHNMEIWKGGISLVNNIYALTKRFPREEVFGLTSQIQRAAVSIPSNIAEGSGKGSDKEFAHFLDHAIASSYELETQLIIAQQQNYITQEQYVEIYKQLIILQKQIFAFKNTLK